PGFTDDGDGLAPLHRERHPMNGADDGRVAAELHAQAVDLQRTDAAHARTRRRGSNASRRPSPTKFTASPVRKMARPGNTVSHHQSSTVPIESESRLPQLGVGG